MKMFSMFTGIGGFDLACRNLNIKIIGACEIDRYARTVYSRHFSGVRIWENATRINPKEIPDHDLLCAGFPCQAFSVAGRRGGFNDTRGTLFFEIIRIAREKQPSILLLENVKGLLSHDKGKTFRIIIESLDELGYDVEWQVLNSKYFVPQNRERVFIVGHLRGSGSRKIFPLREKRKVNDGTSGKTQEKGEWVRSKHSGTIDSNYWKGGGSRTMIAEPKLKLIQNSKDDSYRIYSTDGIARSLRANSGGFGSKTGVYAVLTPDRQNKRQNGRRFKDDGEPSFTLTQQDIHGISDGKRIRRLTPLECERLQGFPDNWTEDLSDTQRYKCLGNAVTVPVVEYIISKFTSYS